MKAAVDTLVDKKKVWAFWAVQNHAEINGIPFLNFQISKKAADDYVQQIRDRLNIMQEEATREMAAEVCVHSPSYSCLTAPFFHLLQMEERKKEEDAAYKDMISMAETLNSNADIEQALYLYAKKLYTAYRTEGMWPMLGVH